MDKVEKITDIATLLSSDNDLSEGFKEKASVLFESAVELKVKDLVEAKEETLEAEYTVKLDEAYGVMIEDVDKYISYIADEWMAENEIALEQGIRTEISEDFMADIKSVLEAHYIDVPEEKLDLVEDLSSEVSDLKVKLSEEIDKVAGMKTFMNEKAREEIVTKHSVDLTLSQAEKLKTISESVNTSDLDEFEKNISLLKTAYFAEDVNDEIVSDVDETVDEIKTANASVNVGSHYADIFNTQS